MSHRKSQSYGSIPFSWEDKPGVCKTPNNECLVNIGSQQGINQKSSSSPQLAAASTSHLNNNSRRMFEIQDKKIPLPPCLLQPPRRSTSEKEKGGFRWQEDPFLVAYKECTKSERNCKVPLPRKNKKGVGSNFGFSKSIFSCRGNNDVRDDIYVKLSQRLPAPRDRSLTLENQHKRGFNYETWL